MVDRRVILDEEMAAAREKRFSELQEGAVVSGTVSSLTEFGAFVDLGGIDGLLHVTDMAWHRVKKPSDLLKEGETIEVKILKVSPAKNRVSLGRKQLLPDPWTVVAEKHKVGGKDPRNGRAADRLRSLCRTRAGRGWDDPCLGDVLDQEDPEALRCAEEGRGRRCRGAVS